MAVPLTGQHYIVNWRENLDVTSVPANSVQEESFTVKGLQVGHAVVVNKHGADTGLAVVEARVSAADTLAIKFWNYTGSAIDPADQEFVVVAL